MKHNKRISLLAVLVCAFALVFSLGILSACGNTDSGNVGSETAGTTWHYGTTAPAEDIGNEGDRYLNTETLTAYVRTAAGTWQPTVLYSGNGAPANTDGVEGDIYLDIKGGVLYQKGASNLWTIVLTVKGEQGKPGRDGVLWFSGTTEPDATDLKLKDSIAGDFYLQHPDFIVWQKLEDGTWTQLGSIKGDKGDDAVNPVQFFDGDGTPAENEDLFTNLSDGDLYVGRFYGADGEGAGSRLYRYKDGKWDVLMDTVDPDKIDIYNIAQLNALAENIEGRKGYAGKEVHLKADLDFNPSEGASIKARAALMELAAEDWTPIGTSAMPFKGIFDGEGHTIYNFSATTTEDVKAVGFFGNVDGATIQHLHFVGAEVTASGTDAFGAVVVGQVQTGATITDVTVESSIVRAEDENAKVGGLVGQAQGTVTVTEVEVSAGQDLEGGDKQALVGSGEENVTLEGNNTVSNEIKSGFVERHHMNGEVLESTTYEILSLEGLKTFRDSVNGTGEFTEQGTNNYEGKTVCLMTDIDLNNEPWTPIGNSRAFHGNFDGLDHKISNLKIVKDHGNPENSFGLFGDFGGKLIDGKNSVFQNLTIENVEMPGTAHPTEENPHGNQNNLNDVGAFAGTADYTDLKNLTLTGTVYHRGTNRIGGIVGQYNVHSNSVVEDLTVDVTDESLFQAANTLGGIFGKLYGPSSSTIAMSKITVKGIMVKGNNQAGGVIGVIDIYASATLSIDDIELADVKVVPFNLETSKQDHFGAIVGIISNANTTAAISNARGNVSVELDPTHFNTMQANMHFGGLVGLSSVNTTEPTVTDCDGLQITWYGFGKGEDGKWHVSSAQMLHTFSDMVNGGKTFKGETIVLDEDADLEYQPWTPIGGHQKGNFLGTFDGQGNTIKNLKPTSWSRNAGFFGKIGREQSDFGVAVKDLNFAGVEFTNLKVDASDGFASGYSNLGTLVGEMENAKIENVHVTDYICMEYYQNEEGGLAGGSMQVKYAGGLVGISKNSVIENCSAIGRQTPVYDVLNWNVSASNVIDFGGIVGYADTENTIENCHAEFTISVGGTIQVVGGIAAWLSKPCKLTVRGCYVNMNIASAPLETGFAGGILGYGSDSQAWGNVVVENCYVTGDLTEANSMKYSGSDRGAAQNVGGILGFGSGLEIKNCFIDADVANDQMTVAVSNDGGDWNVKVTGCSWSKNVDTHDFYGLKSDGTHPNHLYGTVKKDAACSFTAGLSYDAFMTALGTLNG